MSADQDFVDFVDARWASLYRLAYLLTASPVAAEDLLQTALEKTCLNWSRIRQVDYPEAYVRRVLATTLPSSRRRAWLGELPAARLNETRAGSGELEVLDRSLLWPLICALPEAQRAVIVLRYYEDLSEAEVAEALRCPPGTVKSRSSAAMSALGRALAASARASGSGVMTLDEELRVVLREEAEACLPPRPDLTSIIRGGRARRRRRTATRVGVGVLAAALVGGGWYGAAQVARDTSEVTAEPTPSPSAGPTPYVDLGEAPLPPGTYRMFVGIDASGARIEADLTVDGPGWLGSEHPVVKAGPVGEERFAGVSVYRPKSLAGGSGCLSDAAEYDVSTTMDGLARQLTKLPRSTVLQPPTRTTAHGHDAVHLRVRIDTACEVDYEGDGYRLAQSSSGVRGLNWHSRLMLVDFWVVEVNGTPVVVDMFHAADAPWTLVEQASRARESIRFVTRD